MQTAREISSQIFVVAVEHLHFIKTTIVLVMIKSFNS